MVEKRARILVGRQESHDFGPELGITRAGEIHVGRARGWLLQHRLVEDRPQALVPVGSPAHWRIFAAASADVNKGGRLPGC